MFPMPVQEQHTQGVEMPQEALPVGAGLIPVAQHVARYPQRRLCLLWHWCSSSLLFSSLCGRRLAHLWQIRWVQDALGKVCAAQQGQGVNFPGAFEMRHTLFVVLAAAFELFRPIATMMV